MTDIEGSYNTDLLGLLQSARKHGAKAYTGIGKLSEIVNAVGDYGHLPSLIERVREDFNDFKWKIQTPDGPVSQTIDKLVNIWLLQQDLLLGNKFDDFIGEFGYSDRYDDWWTDRKGGYEVTFKYEGEEEDQKK